MTANRYRRESIQEALFALGYLRPDTEGLLTGLMPLVLKQGARAAALACRTRGHELSIQEKKAVGLRAAAAFSRAGADDLTEKGLQHPLQAHEITLMRALFNERRLTAVAEGLEKGADYFLYATGVRGCATCAALRRERPAPSEIDPLHPRLCPREACPMDIVPQLGHRARHLTSRRQLD